MSDPGSPGRDLPPPPVGMPPVPGPPPPGRAADQRTPPPPPAWATREGDRPRPRWSSIDTWPALVLTVLGVLTITVDTTNESGDGTDETVQMVGAGLLIAVLVQQGIQFGWPWLVSRWKGMGIVLDWRFRFEWKRDIGLGIALAVACVVSVALITGTMSALLDLGADADASNTSIISDNQDSPWIIGVILVVVIGAPLSEELLFRGLVLRAFERDLGVYVGVIGSTILFTIPHAQPDATGAETAVLFSGIATIGLILGLATVRWGRLGPAIVGHFFFNLIGVVVTLTA